MPSIRGSADPSGSISQSQSEPRLIAAAAQKNPVSSGLVIGIILILVLAIAVAWVGIYALRGPADAAPTQAPVMDVPATHPLASGPTIVGLWERRPSK